ncbi:MAG: TonB-dependent receptor [Bacteroidales bacterium]|nr:TonB-dependent receptor [Bacteroidales bacterium]
MKKQLSTLLVLMLLPIAGGAFAQAVQYHVSGTLRDSLTNEPIPYVNVIVAAKADTAFVKGTVTDEKGAFLAKGIEPGEYYLKASSIGYRGRLVPFTLTGKDVSLGAILLKPGSEMLQAANIVAERPLFSMEGEKMIYSVKDDPSVRNGNTGDALQNTPGVEVDIQGNVKLRGISSVDIWINDHPSHLSAETLKAYLKSVPASSIKRIETITNPSAKYATDKQAIINIVTDAEIEMNQLLSVGLNGTTTPMASPWLSYMVATKKTMLNVWAGTYLAPFKNKSTISSTSSPWDAALQDTVLTQWDSASSNYNGKNNSLNMGFSFDYNFDSMRNLNSYGYMGHWKNSQLQKSDTWRNVFRPAFVSYRFNDSVDNDSKGFYGGMGLFYTHKLDTLGQQLRLEASANGMTSNTDAFIGRKYLSPFETHGSEQRYENINQHSGINLKARYFKPLNKNTILSAGVALGRETRFLKQDVEYRDSTVAALTPDPIRNFVGADDGVSTGGDLNLEQKWGLFTMELGLGGYFKRVRLIRSSQMPFADDTTARFFNLKPSLHFSYNTKSFHSFYLNYTLNMENPDPKELTTFRHYASDSYTTGSRNLKSELSHRFEAGWSKYINKFGTVGVDAYCYVNQNTIGTLSDAAPLPDPYLNRYIYYSIFANMSNASMAGASAKVMFNPNGKMSLRLYANAFHYNYSMDRGAQGALKDAAWSYSVNANLWWKIKDKMQIFANARYASPTISLGSREGKDCSMDLGASCDLFKNRMTVWVAVEDLFNWGATIGNSTTRTNPSFRGTDNTYNLTSRYFLAGLCWRFGKLELANQIHEQGGQVGGKQR